MGKLKEKDSKKLDIDKSEIPQFAITSLLYYEKDKVIYDYLMDFKTKTKITDKTLFKVRV